MTPPQSADDNQADSDPVAPPPGPGREDMFDDEMDDSDPVPPPPGPGREDETDSSDPSDPGPTR
jgi:hypothetical protein